MSATSRRPSYAAVLCIPHARRTFATALLGRLSYGIVPLSVMLAVTRASGSYAVAGTVMALFGATVVFLAPARAALIDRYGPRRALVPLLLAYTLLLGLLTAAVWRPGTPAFVLGALTALAGACVPPLGPTMRAVWARLAPDRAMLQRAYSLDGVAEELLFGLGAVAGGRARRVRRAGRRHRRRGGPDGGGDRRVRGARGAHSGRCVGQHGRQRREYGGNGGGGSAGRAAAGGGCEQLPEQ